MSSKVTTPPILIGHLPRAEREARKAFSEIQNNTYENKSLGKQKQVEDVFPCDCNIDPSKDIQDEYSACGEHADCINRLTQTECLESECRSKSHCQNQRFQRKQYANVEIVQTEKKGFGLRAGADLKKNAFIYEYIGEFVSEKTLLRRMRAYNEEGIKHFYFMMLQKGEFIDATKRGGIGRFANHSCNPNCYVAKWYVGNRIRMGIFAKRNIKKDEELTFNYNVDRYGHDAQECFCGEPNCVGFIGGKTQTEVSTMDDVYIEALGLDDDQIKSLYINIPKRVKKGKKATPQQIEEDLSFELTPMAAEEASAMVIAIRKALGNHRPMLVKLLSRLEITDDTHALRQLLRLRGLGLMAEVLEEYPDDEEVALAVFRSIENWPFLNRIKIEDVGFEDKLRPFTISEDEELATLTSEILAKWTQLEQGYRIPRRKIDDDDVPTITTIALDDESDRPKKRARLEDAETPLELPPPPPVDIVTAYRRLSGQTPWEQSPITPKLPTVPKEPTKEQMDAIIARAAATAAAMAAVTAPAPSPAKERSKKPKISLTQEQKDALKDKQLKKLVGAVVVKAASKYAKPMGKDNFKKYAEECTNAIAEKEKKSSSYANSKLDKLSEEKQTKIKKYSKEFFAKAMHKIDKKRKLKSESSSRPPSSPISDPRRTQSTSSSTAVASSVSPSVEGTPVLVKMEEDPDGEGEEINVDDFMDEMFGADHKLDDIDEEETLKTEQTPDGDLDGDQLRMDNTSANNTPIDMDALPHRGSKIEGF